MNYSRLLTQSPEDLTQLENILTSFVSTQRLLKRPIRSNDHSDVIAARILTEFTEGNKNHIYISGSFVDGTLVTICVGIKMYPFIKNIHSNSLPIWIMWLMYSTEPMLSNPSQKIFEAGTHLVRKMELDGYYTFYQSFKFPNYKTVEECQNYIDNSFSKMSVMDRYVNLLEYVHSEDTTNDQIPFEFFKSCLGAAHITHNRKMCITSHHLKNEYRNFKIK
jgi:hypothetical protein